MRELLLPPETIEMCWSNEDVEDLWDEPDFREDEIDVLRNMTKNLSKADQKLYNLFYLDRLTQQEIATKLNITQPTVSFRIAALEKSLHFIANLPSIDKTTIRRNVKKLIPPRTKYVTLYLKYPNQATVATKCGVSNSNISKQLTAVIRDENLDPEFRSYIALLRTAPPNIQL